MLLPEIYTASESREWESLLEEAIHRKYKYYASDIIRVLEMEQQEFEQALLKAEKALEVLDIPIGFHIRRIYRSYQNGIGTDMKLSPLAVYFISIHTDPGNSHAASLQLYLAGKYGLR